MSNTGEVHPGKQRKVFAVIRLTLLVLIVAGGSAYFYIRFGSHMFGQEAISDLTAYLRSNRSKAYLILLILQTIQIIVCVLPGQPIQIAGSYMFGIWRALAISLSGAIIGTTISFVISRVLGRGAIHDLFGEEQIEDYTYKLNSSKGLLIVFLIYLIPGIPKDLASYAVGISEMRWLPFLVISAVARTPAMMGSILFGYFFKRNDYIPIVVLCVISLIITIVCIVKRERIIKILDELAHKGEGEHKHNKQA